MSGNDANPAGQAVERGRRFSDVEPHPCAESTHKLPVMPDLCGTLSAAELELRVRNELEVTRSLKRPVSLLSIGIDRARRVATNTLGGLNPVLCDFANTCIRQLRAADVMGRIDDTLYVALLPGTTAVGAQCAAERLRTAIAALSVPADKDTKRRITASIGIATTRTGVTSYRALRSRADAKRDDARHLGGNRVLA